MATIRKRGKAWRVEIARHGIRKSSTFDTKAEASAWATTTEAEFLAGRHGETPHRPVRDLLERYGAEVSATKRGRRWESVRLDQLGRDALGDVPLPKLNASHIAAWRDRRLREVSAASVRREWTLLHHAFNVAVNEWKWLAENPMNGVRRPAPPRARDRRLSQDEIDRLLLALGYDYERWPQTVTARVGAGMLFAIETAMRAGEIAGLTWDRVDLKGKFVRLPQTKNGTPRDVPLSPEALRIVRQLRGARADGSVFGLASAQLDALFRKAKARALIDDLHFHDTRHEAITRLSKKLDVLDLARMVGIRDLRILMVYYNATATEIAGRL
jgi:integrase